LIIGHRFISLCAAFGIGRKIFDRVEEQVPESFDPFRWLDSPATRGAEAPGSSQTLTLRAPRLRLMH
jgi:hypothetical protein